MRTLILVFCITVLTGIAQAEKRVALVIGCENYGAANALNNPKNDAALVAGKLKELKFDTVLSFTDVNAKVFNRKLEDLKTAAFQADVAVFYFAGHGMEVDDVNYLLPIDAVLEEAADLKQEAVSLPEVLRVLTEAQVKAKVIILDCCRNNPFANAGRQRSWMRSRAFNTSGQEQVGMADVKAELAQGTVIMFAAEPGKKAKDGPVGGNSPFAKALEASMGLAKKDGSGPLDVYHTMTSVANAVRLATGGVQKPWLKFDGQPQLMEELAFATVSLGRMESAIPPRIDSVPSRPVASSDPFAGTTAGQIRENSMGTAFRWCPPGEFYMGSSSEDRSAFARDGVTTDDEVQHRVKLTKGFWLSQNDCTQGEWESLMGRRLKDQARLMLQDDTLYNFGGKQMTVRDFMHASRDADPGTMIGIATPSIPIYYVSWEEAVDYCQKLTAREHNNGKLPSGWRYALPTEAQWEYACRADTETTLYNGSMKILGKANAPALDAIAWYAGNSSEGYEGQGWDTKAWPEKQYPGGTAGPRRVGQKKPNAWGLCDMIGNVFQWCADYYGPYDTENPVDPSGSATGAYRVFRGGSWLNFAASCRAASRFRLEPGRRDYLGFRPALVPSR